jgi:hypothetical protein
MKKLTAIFFMLTTSCLPMFAQTNFITAGQTDGMITTIFDPYYRIPIVQEINHHNYYGSDSIDINYDGIYDYRLIYSRGGSLAGSYWSYNIHSLNQNYVMATLDTYRVSRRPTVCQSDTLYHYVAKKYFHGDTLMNSSDSLWRNQYLLIHYYCYVGGTSSLLTDYIMPLTDPYYYILKVITLTDTLLGYLQFSTQNKLFSYACQGQDSIIVNIITSISPDYSINDEGIKIYPNPFSNQISIASEKLYDYQINDYLGRIMLSGKSNQPINTEPLPAGNYILLLKNEDTFISRKIVKGY